MTRRLILSSLVMAMLAGPSIAFMNSVLWLRPGIKYEPPMTEAEYTRLRDLSVRNAEALLKSRAVHMTRTEVLAESVGNSYFWRNLAKNSLVPSLGVFLACLCMGLLDKRRTKRRSEARSTSSSAVDGHGVDTASDTNEREGKPKDRHNLMAILCVVLAFLPCLIAAIYIHAGIEISSWFNAVDLSALLWLGVTCLHYWRTRTRNSAWLLALFPIAFAEPVLHAYLQISSTYSGK
jgi:hypothetical protein